MAYAIIGTVLGLCFFIVPLWAYRRGLQDGLAIKQDKPLEPIKLPSMPSLPVFGPQAKEETDVVTQGMMNILSYDGSPQKQPEEGAKKT